MNEEQADKIIALLEDIKFSLSSIETNTMEISNVDSNTSEALSLLKKIISNL